MFHNKCCLLAGRESGLEPDRASYTGAERLSALAGSSASLHTMQ